MKTRNKIFVVISVFAAFYFTLIPVLQMCLESNLECSAYKEFVLFTRPVVTVDVWDNGISKWNGTVQGIEKPNVADSLRMNQNFIITMILFPSSVIAGIVVWDKRKQNTKHQKN